MEENKNLAFAIRYDILIKEKTGNYKGRVKSWLKKLKRKASMQRK